MKKLQSKYLTLKLGTLIYLFFLFISFSFESVNEKTIEEINRKIKLGEKKLFYAKNFNIDLDKFLATIPENERIQTEVALDPELKDLLNSAIKFKNILHETPFSTLIEDLQGKKSQNIRVTGYTAEKYLEKMYNKIAENAGLRKDLLNETYKDNLQEFIAANNFQNLFNVNDEKFNQIIDNYEDIQQNPEILNLIFKDPTAASKFTHIQASNDFQKILENTKLANTINDERANYKLNQFLENKKNSLNALNYVKALGKNQQLAEDYFEQKAQESGILSLDNAKFYWYQLYEIGLYIKEIFKHFIGNLMTKVSDRDYWVLLKSSLYIFKDIYHPKNDYILSPFSNAKWIELKTSNNNDYKIAVNPNGDVIGITYNKFSIPVEGSVRDQIIDYYYKNKEELLKTAKPITDYPGGYTANAGYLLFIIGCKFLENIPIILISLATGFLISKYLQRFQNIENKKHFFMIKN